MPASNRVGRPWLLEPTHGIQALFEMPTVALYAIVQVLRCPMLNAGQHCAEGRRVTFGFVGRDPLRPHAYLIDRALEESLRCLGVAPLRKVGVNDLSILVNCAIDIRPAPLQTHIRLIDTPFCPDWSPMSTSSFATERGCPLGQTLDPAVHGAPVNHETTLGKPLDNVGLAQPIANIPAHSQGNHVIWEGMVRECARRQGGEAATAVVAAPALSAQPRLSVLACPLASTPNALHGQPLSPI